MDNRDVQKSFNWAIAGLSSHGLIANINYYDLVNLDTCRAHILEVREVGLSVSPMMVSLSLSNVSYTAFRTHMPVSFEDFDLAAAHLTTDSLPIIYSWSRLTFWISPAYFGKLIAHIEMSGSGLSIPGLAFGVGFANVKYGNGIPANQTALQCRLVLDLPFNEPNIPDHIIPKENPSMK